MADGTPVQAHITLTDLIVVRNRGAAQPRTSCPVSQAARKWGVGLLIFNAEVSRQTPSRQQLGMWKQS